MATMAVQTSQRSRPCGHEVPDAGDQHVEQGHGEHELPGEVHELIHAQAWEGAANPDEDADEGEELEEEPDVGGDPGEERKGRGPAAEEEGDGHAAGGEHAEVFAEEEEGEFEAGVFDVVAGDDFGFAFGEVEGRAVGLGGGGDHEEDEADKAPGGEDEPMGQDVGVGGLLVRQCRRWRASRPA